MRIASTIAAAAVLGLAVTLGGMAAAHADPDQDPDNHPGSCLVIDNQSDKTVKIDVNDPEVPNEWEFKPGDPATLLNLDDDHPVISSWGNWDVSIYPAVPNTWSFEPDGRDYGCIGSVRLTLH